MDDRERRRREFRRLDEWLQRLLRDHPVLAWLLAFGLALGIFIVAMLLRAFLEWLGR
jgi:hypothetical protein